jgi:hypothetical protein
MDSKILAEGRFRAYTRKVRAGPTITAA